MSLHMEAMILISLELSVFKQTKIQMKVKIKLQVEALRLRKEYLLE